ncbi:hypothetical protein G0P98_27230, partial [Yangia sp. PrR004]|nr:hypothetical protein [Salipiger sp. PrR004]
AGDAILVRTGLVFVTLTSAVSAYRAAAAEDVVSAVFVAVSYSTLLLLFRSLRAYERLLPGDDADGRRRHLKREVWALCTLLTVLFAWKAAAAMPSSLATVAVAALLCTTALETYGARRDAAAA